VDKKTHIVDKKTHLVDKKTPLWLQKSTYPKMNVKNINEKI